MVLKPIMLSYWHSFSTGRLSPFVTVGAGPTITRNLHPIEQDRTVFGAKAGLGLEYFVTPDLSVGALTNYHYAHRSTRNNTDEAQAWTAGAMLNVFFRCEGSARPMPKPVVKAAPAPEPEPVVSAPPSDTDGDGVVDSQDQCPETPKGIKVDARGCPADTDGDGVSDDLDKCPDTPAGQLVDASGCTTQKVSITLDVKFDAGKADVKPEFDTELAKVAEFMKRFPDTNVEIAGHTDNLGSAQGNRVLSKSRADSVRAALTLKYGVNADRINTAGYGADQPVADNKTVEGRAQNRRVVATISAIEKK